MLPILSRYGSLLRPMLSSWSRYSRLFCHGIRRSAPCSAINGSYLTFPYVGEILLYLRSSGVALALSYLFVGLVLAASFKVRRFWCRFCPTGISIAAANRFKRFKWMPLLRLSKKGEKCTKCGICKRVCPVQVTEVYEMKTGAMDTSMCMLCLRCVEMCPEKDCLSLGIAGQRICSSRNWLEQTP